MPGTPLSSDMQGAEEKIADRSMDNANDLDQAADSLESSERDFIAAEEENGQLIGSIMSEQGGASTATGHSYGRATVGSGGDDVSFGSPGVGHSYGKGDSADGSRLYDAPGTSDGRILRPGVPAGRETLEDPNDFWVGPYGGRGGVEAKPYTGGAKVEAKPFSEELGGVVNL